MTKVQFRRVATFGNTLLAAAVASWCCKSAVEADFPVLLAVGITSTSYSIAMIPPIDAISCPGSGESCPAPHCHGPRAAQPYVINFGHRDLL